MDSSTARISETADHVVQQQVLGGIGAPRPLEIGHDVLGRHRVPGVIGDALPDLERDQEAIVTDLVRLRQCRVELDLVIEAEELIVDILDEGVVEEERGRME